MIKQTATYGVWTVNRHDDNKVEVYKNGQLCEKTSPALREIAAEIGLEVNPGWVTQQLGNNVLKALLKAAEGSAASIAEPKAETPKEPKQPEAPAKRDFEAMTEDEEFAEIYSLCVNNDIEALEWLCNKCCKSRLFGSKFRSFVSEQSDKDSFLTNMEDIAGTADFPKNRNALEMLANCIYKSNDKEVAFRTLKEKKLQSYIVYNLSDEDKQVLGIAPEKPTTKYDANSVENSEDFCENNPDLMAFYGEWNSYNKAQWDSLLHAAEEGDAMAQFKCGYILEKLAHRIRESDNCYQYAEMMDLSEAYKVEGNAIKWFKSAADQGFGLAMDELGNFYLRIPQGYDESMIVEAVLWKEKCKDFIPWKYKRDVFYSKFRDFALDAQALEHWRGKAKKLERSLEEKAKELEQLLENQNKSDSQKDRYLEGYNKYFALCEKKDKRIAELEKELNNLKKDYDRLLDKEDEIHHKYLELRDAARESSSSRSSSGDKVDVIISYKAITRLGSARRSVEMTIPMEEYKSLLKGSMKARIAYVESHLDYNKFLVTGFEDVDISMA